MSAVWMQQQIDLRPKNRGFHLITTELVSQLTDIKKIRCGLAHLFIQHTSASLLINENADPTVREDLENYFNHCVPENEPYFKHTFEGADDMPAHIKAVMLGSSVSIPITNGRLALGIWQGVYLGEHRNHAGKRSIIASLQGEEIVE
jgi:secondary thiamine-phosphate synthase enzyme